VSLIEHNIVTTVDGDDGSVQAMFRALNAHGKFWGNFGEFVCGDSQNLRTAVLNPLQFWTTAAAYGPPESCYVQPGVFLGTGTITRPVHSIPVAQLFVGTGGTIYLEPGRSYHGPLTLNKSLTLRPWWGLHSGLPGGSNNLVCSSPQTISVSQTYDDIIAKAGCTLTVDAPLTLRGSLSVESGGTIVIEDSGE